MGVLISRIHAAQVAEVQAKESSKMCIRDRIYCAAEDSELASKKLKEFLAESKGVKFNRCV